MTMNFKIYLALLILIGYSCKPSKENIKLQVFDMKNADYCKNVKRFCILKYAPIKLKCNNKKLFASEAIGFKHDISGFDTIRVLSICSYDEKLISTFSKLELTCGLENFRDSSVLKDTIYIKGIEGYSNRKLKTVFADIFAMEE